MIVKRIAFLLFLCCAAIPAAFPAIAAAAGQAEWSVGKADLTGWLPDRDGPVILNGAWELYWHSLLTPQQLADGQTDVQPIAVKVPSPWSSSRIGGGKLPNQGYATYRLRIELPTHSELRTLALEVRGIATSYRLWINGKLRASNGIVGTDPSSMKPANYPKLVFFEPQAGTNELVVQVANYVQRKGGIWESIRIGGAEQIAFSHKRSYGAEMLLTGSLLIMGLYHLGLYAFRRKEASTLYFGLLSLSIAVRTIVQGQAIVYTLFPGLPWEIGVKFEYLSSIVAFQGLLLFARAEYGRRLNPLVTRVSLFVNGCISMCVLFTPAIVYTYIMLPYQLFVALPILAYSLILFIRASLHRRIGLLINLIGMAALSMSIAIDILYYNHVIGFGDYVPYGLLAFLFTQSVNLSMRFARTARHAEKLAEQLQASNDSLEIKVKKRTTELQDANEQLVQANEEMSRMELFRTRLISDISHELGTPLTSIKGFSLAMMEGVVTDDYLKYARRIHERSQLLERLLDDLTELAKLENRQVRFDYRRTEVVPFIRQLFHKYEWDLLEQGLSFEWEEPPLAEERRTAYAELDPVRIEQVLANLLSNAQKHAPAGGTIRLRLELVDSHHAGGIAIVSVSDTGPGIPPDETERIFERFYRLQGDSAVVKGSGLGLAICKEIVSYHRGEIGVESSPGTGSRFYFRLPVRFEGAKLEKGA
ncbi:sensor histidine kinase [Cohnella silvisoli]|uniref:histidine kinase n=1 Tax=Cohnella silvisoli TaxID=2873699 RepID=A0ABV1L112_9BACL|nr:sensor histidine kinase [Cohnella silvisoli]MCD9025176.1 sensor histidine kinase [Cohnella silvisoli]